MSGAVLVLNAGSSSIKAAIFRAEGEASTSIGRAAISGLGGPSPRFEARSGVDSEAVELPADGPFESLIERLLAWADRVRDGAALIGVGHRIVHGGERRLGQVLDDDLIAELDGLSPLAPLHQPHNLAAPRMIRRLHPDLPQTASFDTAFHADIRPEAARFALPRRFETAGVRRYGFHGLSYAWIADRLKAIDPDLARGRVIVAHLGAGASLCAMADGVSRDTTMGFTALDGLVMGTRCGVIDPGVVIHLQRAFGLSIDAVEDVLTRQSGLLGLSGVSADMRVLQASTEPAAREAIDVFVYRAAREIAGLTASLGGLDGLVFTAGIGENAPLIRARICERLEWLGIGLDADANQAGRPVISGGGGGGAVRVRVEPTNEEAMIAREAFRLLA